MLRLFAALGLIVSLEVAASADIAPNEISVNSFNPDDAVAPASTVEGPGIKVGEGTVLHPVFGLETGLVSNVFYEQSGTNAAGILRLIGQIGTSSLSTQRLTPASPTEADDPQENQGSFQYRANLRVSYDQMLSGNEVIRSTGGLGVGLSLHGLVNAQGKVSFGFDEEFRRLIRAANYETDSNTDRDLNDLRLSLIYHPRDSKLSGYLYYANSIDIFERSEQAFADRIMHRVGLHPTWRFLPQTLAYIEASWGATMALDSDSMKSSSYPLQLRAGLATLLSLNLTVNVDAGYTNGFYAKGPSFSAPMIGAEVGYRYSPLGRFTVGYNLVYEDSINANYFRDHVIRASVQQLFAPFVLMVQPEVHFRQYNGITVATPAMGADTRDDFIFSLIAGMHYNFRNWIAATVNYRFSAVETDYRELTGAGSADDPSYVRHELLFGMRVAM